ncbi:acetyl-CoA C-acetyltransferase [Spongiibacter taiwanensis]|uniref:acetyl-CoA C-acetyltransferase n=1 Tax=Spongiibacter taiwanensis TaxID=1748242 RepID=UPI0020357D1F|nr:acetyl-CoA C-acetyltransferase [Spongiibacter taiwanensis]USA43831.1 acetyl-CoA C-acetyltransferase [Spongiibacter taiwanensis]
MSSTATTVRRVAIIGGNRIPFARSNTAYFGISNQQMLTAAIEGLSQRYQLQDKQLGSVVAGAVMKHSRDFNLTREAVLGTTLHPHTPCFDIQQACGTGLQAVNVVANSIALGQIEVGIAGGVDTTSDAPIGVSEGLRKVLLNANRAKTTGDRIKAFLKLRPGHIGVNIPANGEPRTGMSMGQHTEVTAKAWNIARDRQDALAALSHQHLAAAYERGFFDDLVSPFGGLAKDNILRPDTTAEKLANLKPAFDKTSGKGTLTAGNSSTLTDGASAVLLASEEWAAANNLPVKAYLTIVETAAVDFFGKGSNDEKEGLLLAPAYAVPRMLEKVGLTLQDFDFYEIHEAFAAQVLATLDAWQDEKYCREKLGLQAPLGAIDLSRLNVNGSSLAAGHPFAATGGRIVATLAKMLEEKGSGRGLISICAAGGQGVTAILER